MKIEKFEDYWDSNFAGDYLHYEEFTWEHQQAKIDHILEYISLIGHQKELDRFLKEEYGRE